MIEFTSEAKQGWISLCGEIFNYWFLIIIGLFRYFWFFLSHFFIFCVFLGMCSFSLSVWFVGIKFLIRCFYSTLNFYKISSVISTLIPDFHNMCFLTFYFGQSSYRSVSLIGLFKESDFTDFFFSLVILFSILLSSTLLFLAFCLLYVNLSFFYFLKMGTAAIKFL